MQKFFSLLAAAGALIQSPGVRPPRERAFRAIPKVCEVCFRYLNARAGEVFCCKNRNCRNFVGQRNSDPRLNSLYRATRLAAQPRRRAPRRARNCAQTLRLTTRRLRSA